MINEYELKITEGGGTTMGQEFGVAMHTTDTNTEEDSLTEAVTKYAERATRAEANMAKMEAKFEERFAVLSEPNLIGYALIKLSKCGGMYTKALERWNKVIPTNRKKWAVFPKHMINEYELKITEGGGTTMGE